jgi:hypothetical protein
MKINKIKQAAEIAKSRTNDRRWLSAIDKAVAGVESGWWLVTELHDGIMVTTETGQTYHANGSCQCRAFELGQPCKHRALARLVEIASEIEETASGAVSAPAEVVATKGATRDEFAADVAASTRSQLIAEIENIWPRFAPGVPLDTELLARFRVNRLDMLDDGALRDIRLAIAM